MIQANHFFLTERNKSYPRLIIVLTVHSVGSIARRTSLHTPHSRPRKGPPVPSRRTEARSGGWARPSRGPLQSIHTDEPACWPALTDPGRPRPTPTRSDPSRREPPGHAMLSPDPDVYGYVVNECSVPASVPARRSPCALHCTAPHCSGRSGVHNLSIDQPRTIGRKDETSICVPRNGSVRCADHGVENRSHIVRLAHQERVKNGARIAIAISKRTTNVRRARC